MTDEEPAPRKEKTSDVTTLERNTEIRERERESVFELDKRRGF